MQQWYSYYSLCSSRETLTWVHSFSATKSWKSFSTSQINSYEVMDKKSTRRSAIDLSWTTLTYFNVPVVFYRRIRSYWQQWNLNCTLIDIAAVWEVLNVCIFKNLYFGRQDQCTRQFLKTILVNSSHVRMWIITPNFKRFAFLISSKTLFCCMSKFKEIVKSEKVWIKTEVDPWISD